ncbi:MAG: hypothetical protein A3D31_06790 [Candidatus Fluviicola riflensis]|nr:MAG: hypothetical protein CHH17_08220 [Candidatus Fluviicola riflensis]OGS79662.1 MAG: hypothetical protein A3D31_06790 [Candidatus Fluviicola riflensis]OGS87094.1 MAG: hypothetical protein A2724_06250 [Fluviicola sp. RIFCSPHIGHO2_01_FULL_43_53]OGS89884.1 MAG: hypothetical protein A3E30_02995 [Fluviicola sp. RIFCSPHIGHO2_12_FULL_43_24]
MEKNSIDKLREEQLLNSKLNEAIRINRITGAPEYGSSRQISNFKDFCLGRQIQWKEIITKHYPENSSIIIDVLDRNPR